jgi:hypothetical protein
LVLAVVVLQTLAAAVAAGNSSTQAVLQHRELSRSLLAPAELLVITALVTQQEADAWDSLVRLWLVEPQ